MIASMQLRCRSSKETTWTSDPFAQTRITAQRSRRSRPVGAPEAPRMRRQADVALPRRNLRGKATIEKHFALSRASGAPQQASDRRERCAVILSVRMVGCPCRLLRTATPSMHRCRSYSACVSVCHTETRPEFPHQPRRYAADLSARPGGLRSMLPPNAPPRCSRQAILIVRDASRQDVGCALARAEPVGRDRLAYSRRLHPVRMRRSYQAVDWPRLRYSPR